MDIEPLPWLIMAFSMGLVFLAASLEIAYSSANRRNMRELVDAGNRRAQTVETLLADATQLLISTMLLKTAGLMGAGVSIVMLFAEDVRWLSALFAVLSLWIVLAALQVLSRAYVQRRPDAVALALAPLTNAIVMLLWPVAALLQRLGLQISDSEAEVSEESVFLTEDGLRLLINVRDEEDSIEEIERQMIASILDMEETVAREIMVPRIDMVALEVSTSLRAALDVIIDAGHSRIPVFEDNIDKILGFLYAKDLLQCFQENMMDRPIRDLLRPAYFVPVTKTLDTLFAEMQKRRVHIAVVVDEYGGTAGLITIEDILEEIVGDIQDEYDEEEESYVLEVAPHTFVLNARLDLDSLSDLLETELPDEDADTLGGLVYSLLGHVPEAGETVTCNDWLLTVLSVDGRRIDQVRVEQSARVPAEDEEVLEAGERRVSGSGSLLGSLSVD